MKRNIVIFPIVLLICLLTVSVYAQETLREIHLFEDWEYMTNESGLTLVTYLGRSSDLEIPEKIHNIPVTMLGDEIFKNCTYLKSITIPDSVTAIGRSVFQGCSSLTDVKLPRELLRIEPYSFRYCTSLEQITLPESLTFIGYYSFSGCIQLAEIRIPDTVTSISESAFDDCTSLTNIEVSKNLSYLEGNAFRNTPWLAAQTDEFVLIGNTVLLKYNGNDPIIEVPYGVTMVTDAFSENVTVESINLPSTVTRIGQNAFRDAVNLKNVSIPNTVTRIDNNAFQGDRSLRNISLPESITGMGGSVFRSCEKLIRIDLPAKMTSISSYFLAECQALTDVTIPSSIQSIHNTAFSGSDQVRLRVTYGSKGEEFALENLIPYTYYLQQTQDFIYSRNDEGIQILKYIGNLFDVEVPAEIDGLPVNRINTAAFQNNSIPRRVILPDSVSTIGDWAFSYMDSLKAIRMPAGLTVLGADAFTGSSLLNVINLSDNVEQIGVEPFEGNDDLVICAEPDSVTAQLLTEMGYAVENGDVCNEQDFLDEFGFGRAAVPQPIVTRTPTPETASDVIPTSDAVFTSTAVVSPTSFSAMTSPAAVTATSAPTLTSTVVMTPTSTSTLIPTATMTPTATATYTQTATMTQTPTSTPTPTLTLTMTFTPTPELMGVIYIPDGTTVLTQNMLENAAYEVTLVIPESVRAIDQHILDDHVVTLIAESGSAAEEFARQWDVKFLITTWYAMDNFERENME